MRPKSPRLAVRALILDQGHLLLVNAWPGGQSPLLCAPGGGVETGQSLPANLAREVHEETGLEIEVGAPCLVNEFHDPASGFHQVEIFFRCTLVRPGRGAPHWTDPEGVVTERHWVSEAELATLPHKPSSLHRAAFGQVPVIYDPLEPIQM